MPDTKRGLSANSERVRIESGIRSNSDKPAPTQIGPYQLIAKIGEGGMGTVWLSKLEGRLAGFSKLAVVKELRADLAGSAEFVEMFLNEARLAARLTHPNVVHTYGANEDEGRLYIAMEYLDGQPWSHVRHVLWSNRSLPLAMHLKVLAETLSGLQYAHELRDYDGTPLQVVHRDMSPQNTFVTYDGQVKVVDFGVARAVTSTQKKKEANLFVGKLAYCAPEQVRGEALDRRADIFAVGVMLWEALAGRRLMEAENRADAVRQRVAQHAPRIREVVPSVPRVLADICDRALALDPGDRYSTAAEFRDAILAYMSDTGQDVDAAQLGQLIGNAFNDERRKIGSLIERHLMHPSPVQNPVEDLIDTLRPIPADHTLRADLSELASVSRLRDDRAVAEASSSVAVRVVKPQRPWQLAAIAVVTTLVTGIWLLSSDDASDNVKSTPLPVTPAERSASQEQLQPPAAQGAIAPLPAAVQVAPKQAGMMVELSVSATPADATIYMDGVPLPGNPYKGQVKSDGELHLIRVSAPGAQTQERVVQFDRDKTLAIALQPKAAERSSGRPRRATGKPARSDATPADDKRPSAREGEPDFDTRIPTDSRSKEIYEEDPYK